MSKTVTIDSEELVATLKAILLTLGVPIAVDTRDARLDHINLHARGNREAGTWIFYVAPKPEEEEEGAGHAD